jgi:hypothetical protein
MLLFCSWRGSPGMSGFEIEWCAAASGVLFVDRFVEVASGA